MTFKLSSKGQVTIPKASRQALGIKPHDKVKFKNNYRNHTVTIKKVNRKHRNWFDRPGLNYQNYRKFCHDQGLSTDSGTVGNEKWRY